MSRRPISFLQNNAAGSEFVGDCTEYGIVSFVHPAKAAVPDADRTPVGQVFDETPGGVDLFFGDAADHDGIAYAVFTEFTHPAAGTSNRAGKEMIDMVGQRWFGIVGKANADDLKAGLFGAVSDQKRQPALSRD
jgi:hypothetical protein